ncbi:uncharacterized protein [Canis lupus baileyi]|uniref:uncharacterized protein LOC106558787 isoform X2 n=1 Tax=Canis lupus familiaris TaxID=9615 RepID=UPI000BAA00F7|nr:uncharacterized protein LOC106558787 isoform X2 [Canis lupus familiaris]XP_022273892.1 uncharacterized protein LOC106558787 isoform X2 [Canis lupus familiaris]XP_038391792.1 uncharacterized protein LOC106558787 isoform X2 [Canis lupus familiaris]XP_038391793.1 uncharacterized protein LOC106558787 isoform X2 [Canis lupus familiaris]XP_038520532.1 uncharacterized protein LOC106558787 isoform X2 [Canis lupus familiaris]|eukprot:XP_022273891.1 uncharacterized protein LOC106558787 isoform X2 [Canis lupus familiaris]
MYICTYKGYIRTHILSHTCTFTPILVSEELLLFPSKANHIYWILIALLCPVPHSFLAWWSQPHNCCERMKKSCLFIQRPSIPLAFLSSDVLVESQGRRFRASERRMFSSTLESRGAAAIQMVWRCFERRRGIVRRSGNAEKNEQSDLDGLGWHVVSISSGKWSFSVVHDPNGQQAVNDWRQQ